MNIKMLIGHSSKCNTKKLTSHRSMIRLKILHLAFYFNNNFKCSSHPHVCLLVFDYKNIFRISFFSIDAYVFYIAFHLAFCRLVLPLIHQ